MGEDPRAIAAEGEEIAIEVRPVEILSTVSRVVVELYRAPAPRMRSIAFRVVG